MVSREHASDRWDWRVLAAIALGVLVLFLLAVVFLILTGIIAEPETVIENIVRALLGR